MDMPTSVDRPLHALIERRWSPYAFAARPVEPEALRSLLEAARWAPSSYNEQPWRFVVARRDDRETFQRLLDCLVPANRDWAKDAPLLLLSVAELNFARDGKPNRHAFHDVGLASAQLALQATALGLGVHFMAGFDPRKARETFAIPEGFEPVAAIAAGYHADADGLAGGRGAGDPAPCRPLEETAYAGQWGGAVPYSASSMA